MRTNSVYLSVVWGISFVEDWLHASSVIFFFLLSFLLPLPAYSQRSTRRRIRAYTDILSYAYMCIIRTYEGKKTDFLFETHKKRKRNLYKPNIYTSIFIYTVGRKSVWISIECGGKEKFFNRNTAQYLVNVRLAKSPSKSGPKRWIVRRCNRVNSDRYRTFVASNCAGRWEMKY